MNEQEIERRARELALQFWPDNSIGYYGGHPIIADAIRSALEAEAAAQLKDGVIETYASHASHSYPIPLIGSYDCPKCGRRLHTGEDCPSCYKTECVKDDEPCSAEHSERLEGKTPRPPFSSTEVQILNCFGRVFPDYAWTDSRSALDLMEAEIKTLRVEAERQPGPEPPAVPAPNFRDLCERLLNYTRRYEQYLREKGLAASDNLPDLIAEATKALAGGKGEG